MVYFNFASERETNIFLHLKGKISFPIFTASLVNPDYVFTDERGFTLVQALALSV